MVLVLLPRFFWLERAYNKLVANNILYRPPMLPYSNQIWSRASNEADFFVTRNTNATSPTQHALAACRSGNRQVCLMISIVVVTCHVVNFLCNVMAVAIVIIILDNPDIFVHSRVMTMRTIMRTLVIILIIWLLCHNTTPG